MAKRKKDIASRQPNQETRRSRGRPPALSEDDRRWFRETLRAQQSLSLSELKLLFEQQRGRVVSRGTLAEALKAMGLTYKKRPLSAQKPQPAPPPPHRFNDRTRRTANSHDPASYPSDLTDAEWEILDPLLTPESKRGRPRKHPRRRIVDALRYMSRTGCQWRFIPKDFPPWNIVAKTYYRWVDSGQWEKVNASLREKIRISEERNPRPSAGILDSQSTKTNDKGEERGFDAGKKVKGRKRHILTDTLGLLLAVVVTSANVQDRDGAQQLLTAELKKELPELQKVWADSAYAGECVEKLKSLGFEVEISRRNDGVGAWVEEGEEPAPKTEGFVVQAKRWVVERTLGWLTKYRRLSKDYEATVRSSRTWILLAANALMLSRLAG